MQITTVSLSEPSCEVFQLLVLLHEYQWTTEKLLGLDQPLQAYDQKKHQIISNLLDVATSTQMHTLNVPLYRKTTLSEYFI